MRNNTKPEKFSRECLDFMEYINTTTDAVAAKAKSARIKRIHERVSSIRQSEKMRVKLM